MTGEQVRLFLVDGAPGGLTTAEIHNWTGHVVTARRSDLARLLDRPEVTRSGVYLLLGDDDAATNGVRCYVGETDVIADRLRNHERSKTFWDRVVVVTSKDSNLTKSHGRYLESRLLRLATAAGRSTLENVTAPPVPSLPEADCSDMDYFLGQLQIVLPLLNVNVLRTRDRVRPGDETATDNDRSPVFRITSHKLGVDARAQEVDGEFLLLEGSQIVDKVRQSATYSASTARLYATFAAQHEQLVANGSIVVQDGSGRVTRDIPFGSPSSAASIVLGRSCNGRLEWLDDDGRTFGQWESRDLG